MGVVFGVAVGVAREVGGAEVGDLGGGFGEKVGVPGRHGYEMPDESVTAAVCRSIDMCPLGASRPIGSGVFRPWSLSAACARPYQGGCGREARAEVQ